MTSNIDMEDKAMDNATYVGFQFLSSSYLMYSLSFASAI
jgi:hypothetical protein